MTEDNALRRSSEDKRRRLACAAVVALGVLALGGCQTLQEVRETILPGQEEIAIEPATAPPTKTGEPRTPPAPAETKAGSESAQSATMAESPRARTPEPSPDVAAISPAPAPDAGADRIVLSPPPGVKPVLRVGLLLPLSGPHAKLGGSLLNAAQLALFGLADEGFAVLPADTAGTPDGAAAAARKVLDDGARLILGPVFASSVTAAAPLARARGVPVLSFSNDRAVAGDGVFVMGFAPEPQIRRVMTFARDRGISRLVALVPDGPFGQHVEQLLRRLVPDLGLQLKTVARYRGISTDALSPMVRTLANYGARRKALLLRRQELAAQNDEASKRALKRLENRDTLGDVDFDAVFLPQGGASLRALAPLLRFYDVDPRKVRLLGTVEWNDLAIATEPAVYGGWFAAPAPAARQGFETAYAKAFGGPPPQVASLAYDATALAAVIARTKPTPPTTVSEGRVVTVPAPGAPPPTPSLVPSPAEVFTKEALTQPSGFAGADGIFRLLPSGSVERGFAVMEVRERRFVVVSPAPQTFQRFGN